MTHLSLVDYLRINYPPVEIGFFRKGLFGDYMIEPNRRINWESPGNLFCYSTIPKGYWDLLGKS